MLAEPGVAAESFVLDRDEGRDAGEVPDELGAGGVVSGAVDEE